MEWKSPSYKRILVKLNAELSREGNDVREIFSRANSRESIGLGLGDNRDHNDIDATMTTKATVMMMTMTI